MLNAAVRQMLRVLLWQSVWLVAATGVTAWMYDARTAWSALAGSGIGLIATAYLATALIRRSMQIGQAPSIAALFGNWLVKSILTLGLLAIALRSKALSPLWVLAAWCGSLAAYWLCMVLGRANGARGKYQNGDNGK